MLLATAVVFLVLCAFIPWWQAGIAAFFLHVGWFLFNFRQGTAVMYRVCAKAYLTARASGDNHDAAVDHMIASRYGVLRKNLRPVVKRRIQQSNRRDAEFPFDTADGEKLAWAIFVMFCEENKVKPPSSVKVLAEIESHVRQVSAELKIRPPHFWDSAEETGG
jgi:hypothetical protein